MLTKVLKVIETDKFKDESLSFIIEFFYNLLNHKN
ncbi:hypothetical protein ACSSV5_001146 [Psychroflexus sp. MBR-150]|jgi:hypothetical protein